MPRTALAVPIPKTFSTAGLPDASRVELWERHNATALIGLSCRTTGPGALQATELNLPVGDVQLARVVGSSHVVERTQRVIRSSPADAIAVYATLRGDAWFEHAAGLQTLRPGHVLIADADQPFSRGFAHGLEELAIKVPRKAFTDSTGLTSLRSPVVVSFAEGGNRYAKALVAAADRATRTHHAIPADERTILGLIAVVATGGDAIPAVAHRAAACSFIDAHLPDRALTASQVAAAIGISERHLSRIFAAEGTSVPQHVLCRRLHLAYSMLADPADVEQTVAEVAFRCGFMSATYFSRVFREYFGQRAGDVRRQAQVCPPRTT